MPSLRLVLLLLGLLVLLCLIREIPYLRSSYYKVTKNPRMRVLSDKGRTGEYLIWRKLRGMEKDGAKFLFNLYLPKEKGGTTEIDVLLLAPQGVFVFESKNYSGWIFGNEKSRYWTQTLPAGRNKSHKEHFLNPIFQNALHIRCLKALIGGEEAIHSVIVFSDRCELKRLEADMSGAVQIVRLENLPNVVSGIDWGSPLSADRIGELYEKLLPFTRVSEDVKEKHVAEIRKQLEAASGQDPVPAEIAEHAKPREPETQQEKQPQPQPEMQPPPAPTAATAAPTPPETAVCPRCGGNLVLRTARRKRGRYPVLRMRQLPEMPVYPEHRPSGRKRAKTR